MSNAVDMRKGVCPKCGAKEIYCRRPSIQEGDQIPVGLLRSARVDRYVCVACGYLESYVDRADLAKVAGKWERVPPEA